MTFPKILMETSIRKPFLKSILQETLTDAASSSARAADTQYFQ